MLGPSITIHNFGYGCTEGLRGKAINFGESGDFVLDNEDVVEFLDVTNEQTTNNIVQAVCISTPLFTLDAPPSKLAFYPFLEFCWSCESRSITNSFHSGMSSREHCISQYTHPGMVCGDTS